MNPFRMARKLAAIRIRDQRELNRFVVRTTALCAAAALTLDVVNQLWFFGGWPAALRSWAITIAIVLMVAVPVTRAIAKAHLALYRASRTDPLTGLLNRRALLEGFEQPAVMALIIVDLDRFEQVNDTHGHLVGDEVLRTVARMMTLSLGESGALGRLGGEEFALLATVADRDGLLAQVTWFRDMLAATPLRVGTAAVSVTISAGLAFRDERQSFEQLYARADRALYLAKADGRNRIVVARALDDEALPLIPEAEQRRPARRTAG